MVTERRWLLFGFAATLVFSQACADASPPEGYEATSEIDDGTPTGPNVQRFDGSNTTAVVSTVDVQTHLQRLARRGAVLPSAPSEGPRVAREAERREGLRRFVLDYAASRPPEELVRVVLDMGAIPFPEARDLRELAPSSRLRVIEERHAVLRTAQGGIVTFLERLGAKVEGELGALNHVRVSIPARAMPEVLSRRDIVAVYPSWEPAVPAYDLEQGRQSTFISEYWDAGMVGSSGSRSWGYGGSGLRLKAGIIEAADQAVFGVGIVSNQLYDIHPVWQDTSSGPTRVVSHLNCTGTTWPGPCTPSSTNPYGLHGTWVAAVMSADLREGQDPAITSQSDRLARTGMIPESVIHYATIRFPDELAVAIFQLVARGVDVINLSLLYPCAPTCQVFADCGGVGSMVRFARDNGVLVVAAAGNSNLFCNNPGPPGCNVCQPALRPEVVSVGNVLVAETLPYDDAPIDWTSSTGWARAPVGGQLAAQYPNGVDVPAVTISAPGGFSLLANTEAGVASYSFNHIRGTSIASPVVASAAALMREEAGVYDIRMLRARLLAMGDGTDGGAGISPVFGAGKAKFHPFAANQAPKANGSHTFTLNENESVTFYASNSTAPMPAGVTQWKIGINIDVGGLSEIPIVTLEYKDMCGGERTLADDTSFGLERHMILEADSFDAETCIAVVATGASVSPGGVTISAYEYYHSGDPALH